MSTADDLVDLYYSKFQQQKLEEHWRRQLWGTGARAPLDFQLVILGITRFTDSDESCARFSVQ